MQVSITDFSDMMLSKAGGKPLSKVPNLYSMLFEAMIELKSNVDLPSSIRTVQITNPIYTNVRQYALPSDISLNGIIVLRAIEPDVTSYDFTHLNARQSLVEQKFGKTNRLAIRYVNGVPYLLVDIETTSPTVLNTCDSLTDNGTVAAIGASSAIAVDELQKMSGIASLTFSVGAGSSNGIEITGMDEVNTSSQRDLLAWVYLPTLAGVTGVKLGFGQGSAHYYTSGTLATDFYGNALQLGWNLLRVPFSAMTIGSGSPSRTSVTYLRAEIVGTMAGTITDFKLDSVLADTGALYEIDYYSEHNFQTISGTYIKKPTLNTDIIALSTSDELKLFKSQFVEIMAKDLKQTGAELDIKVEGGQNLGNAYSDFRIKYPSQRQLVVTDYASSRPNLGN